MYEKKQLIPAFCVLLSISTTTDEYVVETASQTKI